MKKQDELIGVVIDDTRKLTSDLVLRKGIPLSVVLAGMHGHTTDGIMASSMVGRWRRWSHEKIKLQDDENDEMSALMNDLCTKLDVALSSLSIHAKAALAEGLGLPLAPMLSDGTGQVSSAGKTVATVISKEVSEFETVIRDHAGLIAAKFCLDLKTSQQHLVETWRARRVQIDPLCEQANRGQRHPVAPIVEEQTAMTSDDYLAFIDVMTEILDRALSLMSEEAIATLAQDMGLPMAVFPIDDSDQLERRSSRPRVRSFASIDPKGSC